MDVCLEKLTTQLLDSSYFIFHISSFIFHPSDDIMSAKLLIIKTPLPNFDLCQSRFLLLEEGFKER
jgi:hypothetical protein